MVTRVVVHWTGSGKGGLMVVDLFGFGRGAGRLCRGWFILMRKLKGAVKVDLFGFGRVLGDFGRVVLFGAEMREMVGCD